MAWTQALLLRERKNPNDKNRDKENSFFIFSPPLFVA
jgi:hypothetical protein